MTTGLSGDYRSLCCICDEPFGADALEIAFVRQIQVARIKPWRHEKRLSMVGVGGGGLKRATPGAGDES